MKLYTEEQVRQIFENLSTWTGYDYTMETYSDSLTPIELPVSYTHLTLPTKRIV